MRQNSNGPKDKRSVYNGAEDNKTEVIDTVEDDCEVSFDSSILKSKNVRLEGAVADLQCMLANTLLEDEDDVGNDESL